MRLSRLLPSLRLAARIPRSAASVHVGTVLILFGAVTWLNRLPNGRIVAQGDFNQGLNVGLNPAANLFTWSHVTGQGQFNTLITTEPYYAVQWLLEGLGLSPAGRDDAQIWMFLTMSYVSMLVALRIYGRLLASPLSLRSRVFTALLYALNPVTFLFLSYSWGYLHHFLIYLFLPVLLALFTRLISAFTWRDMARFALVSAVASLGFNNLGFLNAIIVLEALSAVGMLAAGATKSLGATLRTLSAVWCVQFLTTLYVTLPFLAAQRDYAGKVTTTQAFGGNAGGFIRQPSIPLAHLLRLDTSQYHFPSLDLFTPSSLGDALIKTAYLLPVSVVIVGAARLGRQHLAERRIFLGLLVVLVFLLLLIAREVPPFTVPLAKLFQSAPFLLLRSPDKLLVFLPAILLLCLALGLRCLPHGIGRHVTVAVLLASFALPFLAGGLRTYLTQGYQTDLVSKKPGGYQVAVTLPGPYLELAAELNRQPGGGAVLSVPYSTINSLNWANYPLWGFVGADPLYQLLNRPYVSADTPDHPSLETSLSFRHFDLTHGTPDQFLALIQKFHGQYLLYHKDIDPSLVPASASTQAAVATLSRRGLLARKMSNRFYDLYELADAELEPAILTRGGGTYWQTSPVEYRMRISSLRPMDSLTLLQSHNRAWRLYLTPLASTACRVVRTYQARAESGRTAECAGGQRLDPLGGIGHFTDSGVFASSHALVDGYANQWTLDPAYIESHYSSKYYSKNPDGSLAVSVLVYFTPQSDFYVGLIALALVCILSGGYLAAEARTGAGPGRYDEW